jgi:hypothetical protein
VSDLTPPDAPKERRGQVRPALRAAINLIVNDGLSLVDAAQRTGMKANSLSVALKKPHVKAWVEGVRRARMSSATFKAWHTVIDLMENAASEDVRHKAARSVLEHAGELGAGLNEKDQAPRQLIQIITDRVQIGQHPLSERLPGVTEAPPMLDITPSRPTRDESDGSE